MTKWHSPRFKSCGKRSVALSIPKFHCMSLILIGSHAFHEPIHIAWGYETPISWTQIACWGGTPEENWSAVIKGWRNGWGQQNCMCPLCHTGLLIWAPPTFPALCLVIYLYVFHTLSKFIVHASRFIFSHLLAFSLFYLFTLEFPSSFISILQTSFYLSSMAQPQALCELSNSPTGKDLCLWTSLKHYQCPFGAWSRF